MENINLLCDIIKVRNKIMKKIKNITLLVFFLTLALFLTGCETSSIQPNTNEATTLNDSKETQTIEDNQNQEIEDINNPDTEIRGSSDFQENDNQEKEQETTEYFKVIKVVDGDTIAVDINGAKETIRLIGINTPETVDPRKPVECFGVEASNKAKELLSSKSVSLEKDITQGERDKYNRLLRYVRTEDGLFYNLEIIKQGYAYEYTYDIPCKYQNEFKQAENYARTNKLGLWDSCQTETKINETDDSIPESKAQTPVKPPETNGQCECSSNIYNCADFKTHAEAQTLYDCCGGVNNDIHKLDSDKDGIACESLP